MELLSYVEPFYGITILWIYHFYTRKNIFSPLHFYARTILCENHFMREPFYARTILCSTILCSTILCKTIL